MVTLKDFKVGQTAIMVGGNSQNEYEEVYVQTVGRKYVTVSVSRWRTIKFEENSFHDYALHDASIYSSTLCLYPSIESYLAKKKRDELVEWGEKELGKCMRKLTTEQIEELKCTVEKYLRENDKNG